ncbi:hypothetical protein B0H17DRAFT_1205214 [Mycena rosella]|uniref:Uncharacterized protein n=1 Tax=Mycena rosella TaxID=1033263 RepID=A0AAD7GAG8_MYCRO|nr:hypothetical protein B0H17DRAFT_1205214 [Mycena rosella]
MQRANCRSFWVYVNIDIDKLPSAPGRPSIDYDTCMTAALRARATKALLIHEAWRRLDHTPRIVHTILIPSRHHIRRLVPVPWSRFVLLLVAKDIVVQDWLSGQMSRVPLPAYPDVVLHSVQVFWVESIASNVLVAYLTLTGVLQKLLFFAMDIRSGLASFLVDMIAPDGLVRVDLRGNNLAILCVVGLLVRICTFEISFLPVVSVFPRTVLQVVTQRTPSQSLFLILDWNRFLVASTVGVSVFEIPAEALEHTVHRTWMASPLWEFVYRVYDTDTRPPRLGPLIKGENGTMLLSLPRAGHLRVLTIPFKSSKFRMSERLLGSRLPDIATGVQIGVYRHLSVPYFVTFAHCEGSVGHPLCYDVDDRECSTLRMGSIAYKAAEGYRSLEIDKGQAVWN